MVARNCKSELMEGYVHDDLEKQALADRLTFMQDEVIPRAALQTASINELPSTTWIPSLVPLNKSRIQSDAS